MSRQNKVTHGHDKNLFWCVFAGDEQPLITTITYVTRMAHKTAIAKALKLLEIDGEEVPTWEEAEEQGYSVARCKIVKDE